MSPLPPAPAAPIVVVSGLPRSGTSMMMKALEAGGIPPLTDHQRAPDEDNPKGYYEFERVKQLPKGDTAWLPAAQGKAVKIITALLPHLPPTYSYRVLFMRRAMPEILASQRQMLLRRGTPADPLADPTLVTLFTKHVQQVEEWLRRQPQIAWLDVDYNAMLKQPEPWLTRIGQFLGKSLDLPRMAQVIDPRLHRQREKDK